MMNGFGGMMGGLGATLVLFYIPLLVVVIWDLTRIFPQTHSPGAIAERARTPRSRPCGCASDAARSTPKNTCAPWKS